MKTLGTEEIKEELLKIVGNEEGLVQAPFGREEGGPEEELGNGGNLIVFPRDEGQVSDILRFACRHSLTVIPEGGGTMRGCGGTLAKADLLLSLRKITGVVEHSAGDLVMTARAGTPLAEIQAELAKCGQFLPIDAPFPQRSTIGGIIAGNASGPKRLRYGSCRDLVIGLRVVKADGNVIRTGAKVVKNVAGYDMNKLFVGSMGTLGVITEANLKLKPLPPAQSLLLLLSQDGADAISEFSRRIMDSVMEPVALEILNPALSERLAGIPGYLLAVAFEDVPKAVAAQEGWVRANLGGLQAAVRLRDGEAEGWWRRFAEGGDAPFVLKAGSLLTDVVPLIEEADRLAGNLGMEIESHGGTGVGISRIYIKDRDEGKFLAFLNAIRSFVSKRGGYVLVEKAPLAVRAKADVWGGRPPAVGLMEGIKRKLDPQRILNPGRYIGGI